MLSDFGKVWCASGARGWFGEGYWYDRHRLNNTTFVAKTTTWEARKGNMLLNGLAPKAWYPDCIRVNFQAGAVLNAVGLSGPGAEALFDKGIWQSRVRPTILSFMAADSSRNIRMMKLQSYIRLLQRELPRFKAPVALQLNFSCPNADLDPSFLVHDMRAAIEIARSLGIAIVPKVNCLVPPLALAGIKGIDALCISNTIPWGKLPEMIPWEKLFGQVSPLARYGGGGLSGNAIIPPIVDWLNRSILNVPIVTTAGQSIKHIAAMSKATYFEIGTVNILRPWRVPSMIRSIV